MIENLNETLQKILLHFFPGVDLLDTYRSADKAITPEEALKVVVARRAHGDMHPVLIYGFEKWESLVQRREGEILKEPGVYYLFLPTSLQNLQKLRQEVEKTKITPPGQKPLTDFKLPSKSAQAFQLEEAQIETCRYQKCILVETRYDAPILKQFAINEIRQFRHRCENVALSLRTNVNRASRMLKRNSGSSPTALKEIEKINITTLAEEYRSLSILAERLGLTRLERIWTCFQDAQKELQLIEDEGKSPDEKVELANQAARCIEEIVFILGQVKAFAPDWTLK